ncbi:uncharacterized protein B0H18DRAFT_955921 [Fomitopsis serialis]|uniref:uncharacterized protein n=1 Tax=Fomitopsis serialis TaxID=139415 RepID=UPI002008CBAD|nr:uncharacterized protein B0H18DRAFT_955921 [Neoantrodia serialis]KAH9923214.1 hypothetical protein B0H18DRAFT_955921 [Neoantrodia serialis]
MTQMQLGLHSGAFSTTSSCSLAQSFTNSFAAVPGSVRTSRRACARVNVVGPGEGMGSEHERARRAAGAMRSASDLATMWTYMRVRGEGSWAMQRSGTRLAKTSGLSAAALTCANCSITGAASALKTMQIPPMLVTHIGSAEGSHVPRQNEGTKIQGRVAKRPGSPLERAHTKRQQQAIRSEQTEPIGPVAQISEASSIGDGGHQSATASPDVEELDIGTKGDHYEGRFSERNTQSHITRCVVTNADVSAPLIWRTTSNTKYTPSSMPVACSKPKGHQIPGYDNDPDEKTANETGGARVEEASAEAPRSGKQISHSNGFDRLQPSSRPLDIARSRRQGYPWHDNSCWLDTSLELIFHTAQRDWDSFECCFPSTGHPLTIFRVFEAIRYRRKVAGNCCSSDPATLLSAQRDALRQVLLDCGAINHMQSREPAFAWLASLLRPMGNGIQQLANPFFQGYSAQLRTCSGASDGIGEPGHHQHRTRPRHNFFYQLSTQDHADFEGDVSSWFRNLLDIRRQPLLELHFELPIMLIVDIGSAPHKTWNFPPILQALPYDEDQDSPSGSRVHERREVEYDIVGRLFYDEREDHFFCRFLEHIRKLNVHEYDGLKANGMERFQSNGGAIDLAGPHFEPPYGSRTQAVVYHLRGGARARAIMSSHQKSLIRRHHSLHITADEPGPPRLALDKAGFIAMPNEERHWLLNPSRDVTVDYQAVVSLSGGDVAT